MAANDTNQTRFDPTTIAFCITDLDAGGAERALVQIVTRLDRSRWSPHVFCLSNPGVLVSELEAADIPVTCFGASRWWNIGVVFRLARSLRRLRPKVLQTLLYHANIVGRFAGRFAKVPCVFSGIRVAERRSRLRLLLDRITQRWVSKHVCVSQAVADFSVQIGKLDPGKVTVIPNGVDVERFANATPADLSEFGIADDHKTILCVGRLDPQKGTMLLLDAFSRVARRHDHVHLLFAGSGPLEADVREYIASNSLEHCVHLAGQRDDVPELMQACDGLVLASLWEGMPNVILEAIAAGLRIVCTAVEGISEVLPSGENATVIPPGDVEALETAIADLLEESAGPIAEDRVSYPIEMKRFAWSGVAEAYAKLYDESLAERAGHR